MKILHKYLLIAFIIENLLTQTFLFGGNQVFFYAFMAVSLLFIIDGSIFKASVYKANMPLFLLGFIYVLYEFSFGIDTITNRTIIYLVAKLATFIIIAVGASSNWNFYAKIAPIWISVGIVLVLVHAIFFGGGIGAASDRQMMGFINANTTSHMGVLALTGFLFFKPKNKKLFTLLAMLFCFYAVLAGGSRNGLLTLAVCILMWNGTSLKSAPVIVVFLLVGTFLILQINPDIAGISRLQDTFAGIEGSNRDDERVAAWVMINEKPITGWGFEAQNVGAAALITTLSSHSGYLETLKFIGWPCTIMWFSILFIYTFRYRLLYFRGDNALRYHYTILVSSLISAIFEGLFVGVHEISTNLIFVSLAVLSTYDHRTRFRLELS